MYDFFSLREILATFDVAKTRPGINYFRLLTWGAPCLRAAALSSLPACSPAPLPARNLLPRGLRTRRPRSDECGNPRPSAARAISPLPIRSRRCARSTHALSLRRAPLPFPPDGVRAPYGRARPATHSLPSARRAR